MSDQVLREGSVFHEKYQVVRSIAQGGMGAVYEVIHLETQRKRALKVMLPSVVNSEELRNRFRAEARVASGIESEHVVETFDAGVDAATGLPFIVMELLRGEDLGKVVARGPLPAADVVALLMQASSALDRMHAHGIVHRDLKPENLFITRRDDGSPRLKVLDFGIAKVVEKAAPSATSTRNMGTPVYMSPEQVLGAGTVGPAADLYAVGHLAFTMLTGQPYWLEDALSFETVYPLLLKIMNGATEPASERAMRNKQVKLPAGFDAWFAKASALAPEDRFKSATASIIALADAIDVPRPMLLSWPLDPIAAAAPTLSPPKDDTGEHRESEAIPLVPRPAPTPRTGPVTPVQTGAAYADSSEKQADPEQGEEPAKAPDRKDDALRTLSPVSTLPGPHAEPAPPSAHRSRSRAVIFIGAAFFLTGVIGAVLLAKSLRLRPDGPAVLAAPSASVSAPAPSESASATSVIAPVPAPSVEPSISPSAEPSASSSAAPSASAVVSARPLATGRVPGPRKTTSTATTKSTAPARPYGDPSRDL